jgi:branched-chain amino acid transport system substrate-binding protein
MPVRRRCLAIAAALAVSVIPLGGTQAADEPVIVIGSILPLTGASAQTGAGLRTAQQLAADLVNGHVSYPLPMVGKNGLPHMHARIKLVFADSQGKPDQARAAAEQLITQEHAVALLGCYTSSTTATASQVAERYGIPFLNPDSSAPGLTARGLKWFFRSTPNDATFAENFYQLFADLKRTKKNVDVKKVAIVGEDGLFGTGASDAEESIGKHRGYDIVTRIAYPATTTEVNAEVQKVKSAAPDVIMMASYLPDALLYMRGFKDQNVQAKAIMAQDAGFIDPGFIKAEGADAEGIFTREVFSLAIKHRNQAVPLIDQLFRQRFGDKPLDGNTARDFMGVLVLADAIDRAGSTKPDAIRTALAATNIPGNLTLMPWKSIKFDAQGQNEGGVGIIEQIQGGKYETVWPFDVATKAPIWPMPAWKR